MNTTQNTRDNKIANLQKQTLKTVNQMIQNIDKGLSGFWKDLYDDDTDGCYNEEVLPQFKDKDRLILPYISCPYSNVVIYGGTNVTGCYYQCNLSKFQILYKTNKELVKKILLRYKDNLEKGVYNQLRQYDQQIEYSCTPLLTEEESRILNQTYADYLEKLYESYKNQKQKNPDPIDQCKRKGFKGCYYNANGFGLFKGQVVLIKEGNKKNTKDYLFKRIFIKYMEDFGIITNDKEDHVWIQNAEPFVQAGVKVGDSVSFSGRIEIYKRWDTRKIIGYELGITNPEGIEIIPGYELPTDEEIEKQELSKIECETCSLSNYCYRVYCLKK